MSGESFYSILGVSENANVDEIKKAYRQLSLKYHPDRNQGDVEKTKTFQKINEAYETLSDNEKKDEYDMHRKNPFTRMNSFGGNGDEMDMNDLFANLFFGGMHGGMPGGMHGGIPGGIFAGAFPPGANVRVFRNGVPVNMGQGFEKPAPITKTIHINMGTVLTGGKIPLEIERWSVENGAKVFEVVTVYVDIFKGVDHNEIIVLSEQGNSINDKCKGDVKVFININNDSQFTRRGLDLIMHKEISLKEALCGFSFEIKYINGKVYTINNQTGNIIPPNYEKVIPNMGLTRENHVGNLIIIFNTKFPETLPKETMEALGKLL
uniref:J domain-containing protein n=1 Tax=viral metagenome TaxID=1070528 RepID=A0A6C0K080_9ZZZZ